ncbi:MAG: murein biosynthesis integral membrane protein MurJ [Pseudomonadota bacterium]
MSLARNTLVQSGLTLSSRILGFLRDVLLAARIGAGPIGDAWATALMFPNLFRRIFAEGAFAQAFVPSYARTLEEHGPEAAQNVADDALKVLFAFTALVTLVAQFAMPWIMAVIHGGQANDTENFNLAIFLTRITMPYLTCMSLAALLSGVLNTYSRFILSAGVPILLNICLIASTFTGYVPGLSFDPRLVAQAAAYAVLIAGVLQGFVLYWGVRRQNVRLSLIGLPRLTPSVKKVMMLAIPGTIAASGTQVNILVSQSLASFEVSAKTWLYYADRLYQLPLGLVGVAVGVAILPRLSRAARRDDGEDGRRTMDEGIGLAMALTLPAAAALFIAPAFLIEGIFTRGAFTAEDATAASRALVHYAWGVPAFVLIKVLAPAFFAREDTKTPMQFALISVAVNTALGAGLFIWFRDMGWAGFPGLAIATSIAAWVNVVLLFTTLVLRGYYRPGRVLIGRLIRAAMATALMSAVLLALISQMDILRAYTFDRKIITTLVFIALGGIAYGLSALITGAIRISDLRRASKRS